MKTEIKQLLESVKNGIMTVDEALLQIKMCIRDRLWRRRHRFLVSIMYPWFLNSCRLLSEPSAYGTVCRMTSDTGFLKMV